MFYYNICIYIYSNVYSTCIRNPYFKSGRISHNLHFTALCNCTFLNVTNTNTFCKSWKINIMFCRQNLLTDLSFLSRELHKNSLNWTHSSTLFRQSSFDDRGCPAVGFMHHQKTCYANCLLKEVQGVGSINYSLWTQSRKTQSAKDNCQNSGDLRRPEVDTNLLIGVWETQKEAESTALPTVNHLAGFATGHKY